MFLKQNDNQITSIFYIDLVKVFVQGNFLQNHVMSQ